MVVGPILTAYSLWLSRRTRRKRIEELLEENRQLDNIIDMSQRKEKSQ